MTLLKRAIYNHLPSELIVDIFKRFDFENFMNENVGYLLTWAFAYSVELKVFKLLYEIWKSSFSEVFFPDYCIYTDLTSNDNQI